MVSNHVTKLAVLLVGVTAIVGATGTVSCTRRNQSSHPSSSSARRSVILITLDTTRTDRLHCYGHSKNTSPNLDALAADGVRFDLAIAQAGVTTVSHASILTGLYPPNHGVRVIYAASGYYLADSIPTLASVLPQASWSKGAFLSSFNVSEFFGFERGFDHFDNGLPGAVGGVMRELADGTWGFNIEANQRRSDETTESAIAWLRQTRRPFFVWVHYWDPHDAKIGPPRQIVEQFRPPPGTSRKEQARAPFTTRNYSTWILRLVGSFRQSKIWVSMTTR